MSEPIYCEGDCQEVLTWHCLLVQLYVEHAALRQQLATVTQERDDYKERAKWKHVHDDSLEMELQRQLATVTAERDQVKAIMRGSLDLVDQAGEISTLKQQLASRDARIARLEEALKIVAEKFRYIANDKANEKYRGAFGDPIGELYTESEVLEKARQALAKEE